MNAELKTPMLVLSLALLAWAGMNFAGTIVERRGKEASARRLAELTEKVDAGEIAEAARKAKSRVAQVAVLVKPVANAPLEIVEADKSADNDSPPVNTLAESSSAKAGSAEAPVP